MIERHKPVCVKFKGKIYQLKEIKFGKFEEYLKIREEFNSGDNDSSSKGREFPVVFIVDVAANKLPLRYQAKKFYVPTDLSKGLMRQEDEKELYIQEEPSIAEKIEAVDTLIDNLEKTNSNS